MKKEEKVYRGAPNWETWAIHAWISNVEHIYWEWREQAEEVFEQAKGDSELAMKNLAAELKQEFTDPENIEHGRSSLAEDVTEAELETVVWEHVADNLLSQCGNLEYSAK